MNYILTVEIDLQRYILQVQVFDWLELKVRQFQNEFMKSSFLPKYEQDFCPHYTGQKS